MTSGGRASQRPLRWGAALLGGSPARWLIAGALSSLALAAIEFWVARLLQLFLGSLGLLQGSLHGPHRFEGAALRSVAGALVVIAVLRGAAQYVVSQSAYVVMENLSARLRHVALWDLLCRAPTAGTSLSRLTSRVTESFPRSGYFVYLAAQAASSAVQATLLCALMAAICPRETALALVGIAVLGGALFELNRRARGLIVEAPAQHEAMLAGILNAARNLTLVRVLRVEGAELSRLRGVVEAYQRSLLRSLAFHNAAQAMTPFVGILLIVGFLVTSQRMFGTPGAVLLSFLYLFTRFVLLLSGGVTQLSMCTQVLPQVRQTTDYLDGFTPDALRRALDGVLESAPARDAPAGPQPPPELRLEGVSFSYPNGDDVLRGVSLEVPAGQMLAIVGPNGGGKSTLLSLLLGLLRPTEGRVRLGGRAPQEYFLDPGVRVGYVGPEAFFIAGTMRDNLTFGARVPVDDDGLWAALRESGLEPLVRRLPGGLDARVSEDGAGFSAGEKQRFCLVRACLHPPHVLVLDEPTANLDRAAERAIADSLGALRGRCTTLLVTHRRAVLRHADRVLHLEDGQLSASPIDAAAGPSAE